jgi:hypothetical protein
MSASFYKAGLGACGLGLKSSQSQSSAGIRMVNFNKLFPDCVRLAPSPQSLASGFIA